MDSGEWKMFIRFLQRILSVSDEIFLIVSTFYDKHCFINLNVCNSFLFLDEFSFLQTFATRSVLDHTFDR